MNDESQCEDLSIAAAERIAVIRALRRAGWSKRRAAAMLGCARTSVYRKMENLDIPMKRFDTPDHIIGLELAITAGSARADREHVATIIKNLEAIQDTRRLECLEALFALLDRAGLICGPPTTKAPTEAPDAP